MGFNFDMLHPYMRLILFGVFYFGKIWKNLEKRPFFRTATAGLGIHHTGGYGRIGVYRVKLLRSTHIFWYLDDSLSLSSRPFMLALFTI